MTDINRILDMQEEREDAFFLLDMDVFEKNYEDFLSAFRKYWKNTYVAYSFKTNYIPDLCRKIFELGGAAEVVSDMELYLAQKVGFSDENIYFNGPYKQELVIEKFLLDNGNINIDSLSELEKVISIVGKYPEKSFNVALRWALDIEQETPSRFGFDTDEMDEVFSVIDSVRNLDVVGIHTHLPYRSVESFSQRLIALKKLLKRYSKKESLQYLSIGGGFMGPMSDDFAESVSDNHKAPTFDDYASIIGGGLAVCFKDLQINPKLILEPGSALVANAMSLFAKVENIKRVRGKTFITVVASTFNMNPTVKGLNRPISIHHIGGEKCINVSNADMVGYTCIEGDCLFHNYEGEIAEGDFVEFHNVGSYSITMNPSFIRPIPSVIKKMGEDYFVCKQKDDLKDVFGRFICFV